MPIDYAGAIDSLAETIADINESKGFSDTPFNEFGQIFVKTALIANEVSEAEDVYRDHYDDDVEDGVTFMTPMQEADFTEELADIIIRTFDLSGYLDLQLGHAVIAKIEKNRGRPPKHGKRF